MHTLILQHLSWGWQKSTCNMSFSLAAEILKPPVFSWNSCSPESPQMAHFQNVLDIHTKTCTFFAEFSPGLSQFPSCYCWLALLFPLLRSQPPEMDRTSNRAPRWWSLAQFGTIFGKFWRYLSLSEACICCGGGSGSTLRQPNTCQTEHWSADCHEGS